MKLQTTTPVFLVSDVGATIRWYESTLGFEGDPFPPNPPYVFGILRRDDVEIMLQRLEGYEKPDLYAQRAGGVWDVYVRCEGVRELYDDVVKRGEVTVLRPLCPQPYGQLEFEIRDPNGYVLVFAERTA
jgi:uncharacterized glyoxalase superfamily protein PhnB